MKSRLAIILFACTAVAIPLAVYAAAATLSLSPASGTLAAGTTRSVSVYVTPQGGAVYTVKAIIHFPAGELRVQSFTPAPGVIPLSQPGYDLTDNAGGELIKTVGLPKGATSKTLVGTIVFSAVHAGAADVTIGSDSLALAADNSNAASSFGAAHFTLTPAPIGTKPTLQAPATSSLTATSVAAQIVPPAYSLFSVLGIILALVVGFFAGRKTTRKDTHK